MVVWIFFVFLLVGLLFYSVMFFLSNIFIASQQGLRLSPFEDNVKVDNTDLCTDSDNGIYFKEKGKKVRKGEITNFVSFDLDPNKWSSGNFEARVWLTEGMTQSINGQESSNSTAQITLEMIESGVVQMVKVENKTGGDLEPDELGEFVGEVEAKIKS